MKILLTNDDGINAKGIYALAEGLSKYHQVWVVAPNSQKSACSHSITILNPLLVKAEKLKELDVKAFSVTGTPADCVRIGLDKLVEEKIDLVVSGINRGLNVGTDVIYSGTVSAAIESAIYEIPSLAVSQEVSKDIECYENAVKYTLEVIEKIKNRPLGEDVVLNLNIPLCESNEIKGIKVCKIGKTRYAHSYVEYDSNLQEKGYKVSGEMMEKNFSEDDVDFIRENYVTLTPLHFDLTNFDILKNVENFIKE